MSHWQIVVEYCHVALMHLDNLVLDRRLRTLQMFRLWRWAHERRAFYFKEHNIAMLMFAMRLSNQSWVIETAMSQLHLMMSLISLFEADVFVLLILRVWRSRWWV